ncbi:MAG: hypothetical protein NZ610_05375 [Candidatus Bipolaricaulota bacterium]|nr:hypothetical protein [Candidatus Bipolaricaulota bacterium]MCS7274815.1 hypothetical protein [Candidatus Bipolaricaulota bacterium]MDW8111236.1 hypothetical protein [Candidatus Bipolaricaulota bacterium]MDW8328628.1 hypothetical protein [Candidatus Bipolaricaulota bacterium]
MSILWVILIAGLVVCLLSDCLRKIKITHVELPREATVGEEVPLRVTLANPRHLFRCHQYIVLSRGPSAEIVTKQEVTLPPESEERVQLKIKFDRPGHELIQIDGQRYWIDVHSTPAPHAA